MRGHIQQRGKDSWRVKVFVGRDATGARRYVERTVRGTGGRPNGRSRGWSWRSTRAAMSRRRR
jgi:hypothetical protein